MSKVGDTLVNENGYHNTKTEAGWRLTHHILAEEILGRPLAPGEFVRFKDTDRANLNKDNLEITTRGASSLKARLARVEAKIQELQAERDRLVHEIASSNGKR